MKTNLREQLDQEAAKYGLIVEDVRKGVEVLAPDGFCFDKDLHGLVSSQWDHMPMPNVFRNALRDIREYGPKLMKCPDDCGCKD